jgi:hypothetical protein
MNPTRTVCAAVCAGLLLVGLRANGQLAAPGALDKFSGCAHHTCTWVPFIANRSFRKGDFSYTVEPIGEGTGSTFVLARADKVLLRAHLQDLDASVSVVWAEDQKNFAVTWSDGGAIGGFHVRAFHVDGDSVSELPVANRAFESFKAQHWCEQRGDNIQAHSWLNESRDLLLILSVYPTSDCGKEMGHTEAYLVEATTGQIREHWDVKRLNSYMRSHPE